MNYIEVVEYLDNGNKLSKIGLRAECKHQLRAKVLAILMGNYETVLNCATDLMKDLLTSGFVDNLEMRVNRLLKDYVNSKGGINGIGEAQFRLISPEYVWGLVETEVPIDWGCWQGSNCDELIKFKLEDLYFNQEVELSVNMGLAQSPMWDLI